MNEEASEVGHLGSCVETAREAVVLAVRAFGVPATLVQQAERECAAQGEVIAILTQTLRDADKRNPRVRAAWEACEQTRCTMRHHHGQDTQRQTWTPGSSLAAGAPGATTRTARQAVLLAMRALGDNAKQVEQAAQGRDKLDKLLATLTDDQKGDAVVIAAIRGSRPAVAMVLAAEVDLDHKVMARRGRVSALSGLTPLVAAIKGGDQEILHLLIAAGADCEQEAKQLRPLMWAASRGCLACVQRLLLAGASVNAQSSGGSTALHCAVSAPPPVDIDIDVDVDVDSDSDSDIDIDGDFIEDDDHPMASVVMALLGAGANKVMVDGFGRTALQIAEGAGCTQVANLLRD